MNFKKVFAALAATAVAATMAVSASAEITNPNTSDTDRYVLKLNEIEGFDVKYSDIYGATFTYTGTPEADQTNNGAIAWMGENVNWAQKDFSLDTIENNSFTYLSDTPLFPSDDLSWAQVLVAQWDGEEQMTITIDKIQLLGKNGDVLATYGDNVEEENKPSGDNVEEENKPSDDNSATGAASGLAFAGIALAGAALTVSKKHR